MPQHGNSDPAGYKIANDQHKVCCHCERRSATLQPYLIASGVCNPQLNHPAVLFRRDCVLLYCRAENKTFCTEIGLSAWVVVLSDRPGSAKKH